MNPENLAPIYLDNQPITLKDPKPKLSAVLMAGGKTNITDVKWLQFQPTPGKTVRAEEVLDRTSEPNKPIYLTSKPGGMEAGKAREPGALRGPEAKGEHGLADPVAADESSAEEEGADTDERRQGGKPAGREFGHKSSDE